MKLICVNINHPKFNEVRGKVPTAFISQLVSENENISSEEIYSKYILKLQEQESSKTNPVLPLKGNEYLYKKYNLLANDGKIKIVPKRESKKWLETLNKSPNYSFVYRLTPEGGKIFITNKEASTQIPLFSGEGEIINKFSDYITKESDTQSTLKKIAEEGGGLGAVAKQLLKSRLNVPIEVVNVDYFNNDNLPEGTTNFNEILGEDFKASAFYSPNLRKIFLAKNTKVKDGTKALLLHEILHAYTNHYIINNPDSSAVKNLNRLLKHLQTDQIKQTLSDTYPLTDLDELLVGIFTNQKFINDLKKLPPTNKNFTSIWDEIVQIFKVIFGITDKTLFDEVFAASSVVVDESISQMVEQEEFNDLPLLASPASNIQKIISDKLDTLSAKVKNVDQKYIVEGFDINWLRPSQIAKSGIQKRTYGVKTEQQEEFEKLAQEAGTVLHNIQANIIKEAFPEFNKHIEKAVIDDGMSGFENAMRIQLAPIIKQARERGSILKAEVWIGNTKTTKGGTVDLLEIDKDGNYYVYDLKTRFSEDTSPLRRYSKVVEWSEQTGAYNEILKSGDAALGVVKGKVLGTYIFELDVQIKPQNKFVYNGVITKTSAEKFLKRRELKNIKIVAPTFLRTGNRKMDEMIGRLVGQIENLTKSKVPIESRQDFDRILNSKLDLLQSLQLKQDISLFVENGFLELAIIKKQLEDKNLNNSRFIKEQLELYTNALQYLNPIPEELKDSVKRIQAEAQDLQTLLNEIRKDIVEEAAKEVEVTKLKNFKDNIFSPVKDIGWVFSQTMGVSDIDNPIVQTLFRKTTEGLEKSREKIQELGDKLLKLSDSYIKSTGDLNYSKLIENNHLVDQWQSEFWIEFNGAKKNKNFDWAKENVTFDKESYLKARNKQLDYHDTITREIYKNKVKLSNPDLGENEINRVVEEEISNQMKKWDNTHNNSFTYFIPKDKWINPKYKEIIEGKSEIRDLYNFLKSLIEYSNEILPEKVKKNFIPNYQNDFIQRSTDLGLIGALKGSWSGFIEDLELTYDDEIMSQKDAVTGEKLGTMWIPGITEVKNKSLDLPVVFFKFMEGVYRYEELKTLEELAISTKEILKQQQWLAVDALGNAISTEKTPARPNSASRTLSVVEGWVDHVFYNKSLQKDYAIEIKGNGFTELIGLANKGDSKKLSVGKMVDKVIKWTTLKNLGFSLYSPVVNLFGGTANMYMTGANGAYYSSKDMNKAMRLALSGKVNLPDEDSQKAKLILDWLQIDSGEFIKKQEEGLTNSITKKILSDYNAMSLMRESESILRNAGALAVILGGKFDYNWDSFKVIDGKLSVEANDFQKSKLKQQIIKINRKNIGGISADDTMLAKQYIVGRMLMQHRSWLPALFFERFGSKKYDYVLEKDIEGRYTTLVRTFKHLFNKSKYKELEPFEKENLKSCAAELALLLGTGILLQLLKSGLDDDDRKEAWSKITTKVSSRVFSELLFFVDPTFESQYQILLSPAPVLGTAGDVGKFIGSIFKESDDDKRTKTTLQRGIKLTPFNKVDAFLTDLGISPIDEK